MDVDQLFEVSEKEKNFAKKNARIITYLAVLHSLPTIVFVYYFMFLEKPLTWNDPVYFSLTALEVFFFGIIAFYGLKTGPIRRRMNLSKKAPDAYKNRLKAMGGCTNSNKRNILYKTLAEDYPDLFSSTKKVWGTNKAVS